MKVARSYLAWREQGTDGSLSEKKRIPNGFSPSSNDLQLPSLGLSLSPNPMEQTDVDAIAA